MKSAHLNFQESLGFLNFKRDGIQQRVKLHLSRCPGILEILEELAFRLFFLLLVFLNYSNLTISLAD